MIQSSGVKSVINYMTENRLTGAIIAIHMFARLVIHHFLYVSNADSAHFVMMLTFMNVVYAMIHIVRIAKISLAEPVRIALMSVMIYRVERRFE